MPPHVLGRCHTPTTLSSGVGKARPSLNPAPRARGGAHPTFPCRSRTHCMKPMAAGAGGPIRHADDRELVELVAEREDERAFRALYDRHTPRLLRFALRLTAGRGSLVAEDVVQETWIRAVERLGEFAWRSTLDTWLHGIASNVVRELRRRPDRSESLAAVRNDPSGAALEADDPEARIDLERGLALMPDGRRTVLVLHDLYGYSHAEVARMLEVSEGTSKSQLHDARRQLASLLTAGDIR